MPTPFIISKLETLAKSDPPKTNQRKQDCTNDHHSVCCWPANWCFHNHTIWLKNFVMHSPILLTRILTPLTYLKKFFTTKQLFWLLEYSNFRLQYKQLLIPPQTITNITGCDIKKLDWIRLHASLEFYSKWTPSVFSFWGGFFSAPWRGTIWYIEIF